MWSGRWANLPCAGRWYYLMFGKLSPPILSDEIDTKIRKPEGNSRLHWIRPSWWIIGIFLLGPSQAPPYHCGRSAYTWAFSLSHYFTQLPDWCSLHNISCWLIRYFPIVRFFFPVHHYVFCSSDRAQAVIVKSPCLINRPPLSSTSEKKTWWHPSVLFWVCHILLRFFLQLITFMPFTSVFGIVGSIYLPNVLASRSLTLCH